MIKITGLDRLTRQFDDASKAISALDGELCTVKFDPSDPASIEAAIQQVVTTVDERLGGYMDNPIIAPIAAGLKEKYREAIVERAAAARLKGDEA